MEALRCENADRKCELKIQVPVWYLGELSSLKKESQKSVHCVKDT